MAAGAMIAFFGVAMLSRILITPTARGLGLGLVGLLWVARLLGRVRDAVPVLGLAAALARVRPDAGLRLDRTIITAHRHRWRSCAAPGSRSGPGRAGGRRQPTATAVAPAAARLAVGSRLTTSGRLARGEHRRNPGRTAVTAAALMIGVALVVFAPCS